MVSEETQREESAMQIDVTLDSKGYLPDRFAKYSSELYKGVPTCSFPFSVSGLPTGTQTLALSFVDFDSYPSAGSRGSIGSRPTSPCQQDLRP